MQVYYIWLALFAFVGYYVITDESVAEYVYIFFFGVWVQLRKYYYMAILHPFWFTNPVGKWWMMRKYRKIAKDIVKHHEVENQKES